MFISCVFISCVCIPYFWSPLRDLLSGYHPTLSESRVVWRPFLCVPHRLIPCLCHLCLCCWLATSSSSDKYIGSSNPFCFLYFPSVTSVVWQHLVHRPGIRIPARRPLPRDRRYYWPSKERLPSSTTISSRCPAVVDAKVPRGRIRSSLLIVSGSRKLASWQFPFQSPRSSIRTTATHILLYLNFH